MRRRLAVDPCFGQLSLAARQEPVDLLRHRLVTEDRRCRLRVAVAGGDHEAKGDELLLADLAGSVLERLGVIEVSKDVLLGGRLAIRNIEQVVGRDELKPFGAASSNDRLRHFNIRILSGSDHPHRRRPAARVEPPGVLADSAERDLRRLVGDLIDLLWEELRREYAVDLQVSSYAGRKLVVVGAEVPPDRGVEQCIELPPAGALGVGGQLGEQRAATSIEFFERVDLPHLVFCLGRGVRPEGFVDPTTIDITEDRIPA